MLKLDNSELCHLANEPGQPLEGLSGRRSVWKVLRNVDCGGSWKSHPLSVCESQSSGFSVYPGHGGLSK